MIEICEHPANDTIREHNKIRLSKNQNARPLIRNQMRIRVDGRGVGWLNKPRNSKPCVAMTLVVDDETLEEIDREVQRYLGESVLIGLQSPDDEPDEPEPPSQIILPDGVDLDDS